MSRKRGLGSGLSDLITASPQVNVPQLREVPITAVVPNPHQPRAVFHADALNELTQSIAEHGVLQPLVVTRTIDDQYQLIAGERRLRAAKQAGLTTVPVVIKEASEQQQLEFALIENIQRADLDPIEEARAYALLEDQFGLDQKEIAKRVGKSRTTISETLGLLKLPVEVQELVSAGSLTPGHARAIASLRNNTQELAAAQHIAQHHMSVRQATQYVADLTTGNNQLRPQSSSGKEIARSHTTSADPATVEDTAIVKAIEEQLGGFHVKLLRGEQGGRLVIYFDNEEMLSSLYDRLMNR